MIYSVLANFADPFNKQAFYSGTLLSFSRPPLYFPGRSPGFKAPYTLNPKLQTLLGGAGDLESKVMSRVIIGVTPFRVLITLF